MWFYHGRRSFVEFRSGSEDRNCANKATVLDQWMYTYTQNRILHHEDCPAGSLYPWKWLSLVGNEVSFEKLLPSCWRSREWLCNLVLWRRLISVLLTNQIEFLDMFCWFNVILKNKKISCFSENCCIILCDGSFNTLHARVYLRSWTE